MCLAAYEQLSHPESDRAMVTSAELAGYAMLEDDSAGEHSVQMAMLLISAMSTGEKGFTH
jgi:hypothetical protein